MFTVTVGEYELTCSHPGLPMGYDSLVRHAKHVDQFGELAREEEASLFAVARTGDAWPFLVVMWHCWEPDRWQDEPHPAALIVPETDILFLGGGDRVFAYDLSVPRLLWSYTAAVAFRGLSRHGDVVIMSEELEMRAWDVHGRHLWSTFAVAPPWDYTVEDGIVHLDVMGAKSEFPLATGPEQVR